jgi:dynein heavy chain, axonemal
MCLTFRSALPLLFGEFERCQRSLEGYIERKRTKFPRLYFVSNPVLLQILSQGSEPKAVQPYYEKMFDAITSVVHDKKAPTRIVGMRNSFGKDYEEVSFVQAVNAVGHVEDWLCAVERAMKSTVKVCSRLRLR